MTPKEYFYTSLHGLYSERELQNFYYIIIQYITKKSLPQILIDKNNGLSNTDTEKLKTIVLRLQKQEPLQYILKETTFCGFRFNVNENVLIPRPETEELVFWIQKECTKVQNYRILDIGTGSGCIAISLAALLPTAQLSACDISEEALYIAQGNARNANVNVHFFKANTLSYTFLDNMDEYDIIVSNPPYICQKEKTQMEENVLNYEPHLALFVPDEEPLLFYKNIASTAKKKLTPNGKLFFEINRAYAKQTSDMLEEKGFINVLIRKDFYGNNRMIMATKPE